MRNVISTARARQLYGNTAGDERAGLCAHQVQAADRSLLTPRHLGLPIRMAPHHREPQPAQVHRTGPPPRAPDGAPVTSPAPNHFQHSQHRPTVLSQDLSNSHDQDRGHSAVELSVALRDLRQQRGCHLARLPVVVGIVRSGVTERRLRCGESTYARPSMVRGFGASRWTMPTERPRSRLRLLDDFGRLARRSRASESGATSGTAGPRPRVVLLTEVRVIVDPSEPVATERP
jgi:hypothetical protein